MFLPTNRPTRRQFLERSALGAGSLLVAPLLLDSCTDHVIPPSNPPILTVPPLLGDYEIDWSDAAKTAVTTGISVLLPEGGEILSALVDIFWPGDSKPSPWDQVRTDVENLVNQKIGDFEYELVSEDLQGLGDLLVEYKNELYEGSNEEKLIMWLAVRNAFAEALPHFQSKDYQVPLLGLFGQFANLYLSILRDVVIKGQEWGRTDADHDQDKTDLTNTIGKFTDYVNTTYKTGHDNLANSTAFNYINVEPFRTVNAFDRQMTLLVLDFKDYWQYYDVTKYPQGSTALLTRIIYTDPVGQGTNRISPFSINTSAPTKFPTGVDIWTYTYINAVQLTYPPGGGPDGLDSILYGAGNKVDGVKHDYIDLATLGFPIIQAHVTYGEIVNSINFTYDNNTTPADPWGTANGGSSFSWGYNYQSISVIIVDGPPAVTKFNYAAGFAVFGFQYSKSSARSVGAMSSLYIKSPKEKSAADLAKPFPELGISANSITEELKAARKAYWAAVKARAEKIKNKPK